MKVSELKIEIIYMSYGRCAHWKPLMLYIIEKEAAIRSRKLKYDKSYNGLK